MDIKMNTTLALVILLLLMVVGVQQCMLRKCDTTTTVTRTDTFWVKKDTQYITVPNLVYRSIQGPVRIERVVDSIPGDSLRKYYKYLLEEYTSINVYKDTISQDSNYVYITDTISENRILARAYSLHFNTPVVTKTVTIPEKQRLKVFLGGGVEFNPGLRQVNLGLSVLPGSSNYLIGVYTGISNSAQPTIGVNAYWKLSLKR